MKTIPPDTRCRLCHGSTSAAFSKLVMHKHKVQFFECQTCGSLQTETPYWLDEAYQDARRFTDTYGGVRAVRNQVLTYYVFRILGLRFNERVVDWGGGDGLTARVLRDVGLDAYSYDRYAQNSYAIGFDGTLEPGLGMITSFEVWEHLAEPARELSEVFVCEPRALLISTGIYSRQGQDWNYLGAYSGRHVFFYSPDAMKWIAKKFGYEVLIGGGYALFSRMPLNFLRRLAIRILLDGRFFRLFQACLAMRAPRGRALEDFERMRRLVRDDI